MKTDQTRLFAKKQSQNERVSKGGGNVVSYICTHDGEVIHSIVGPVNAVAVLSRLQWARKVDQEMKATVGSATEDRVDFIRNAHIKELRPGTRSIFEKIWGDKPKAPNRVDDLAKIIGSAKETIREHNRLMWSQAPRLSRSTKLARARSAQWKREKIATQDDILHLIFTQVPLVPLEQIEKAVFEGLAGQRYNPRSSQNDENLALVRANVARRRPVLIRINDVTFSNQYRVKASQNQAGVPKHKQVQAQLRHFGVIDVSSSEFTTLTDDLNQKPVELADRKKSPKFILLDRRGNRVVLIMQGNSGYRMLQTGTEKLSRTYTHVGLVLAEAMQIARAVN